MRPGLLLPPVLFQPGAQGDKQAFLQSPDGRVLRALEQGACLVCRPGLEGWVRLCQMEGVGWEPVLAVEMRVEGAEGLVGLGLIFRQQTLWGVPQKLAAKESGRQGTKGGEGTHQEEEATGTRPRVTEADSRERGVGGMVERRVPAEAQVSVQPGGSWVMAEAQGPGAQGDWGHREVSGLQFGGWSSVVRELKGLHLVLQQPS